SAHEQEDGLLFARARGVSDGRVKAKPRSFRTAAGPQIQVTEHGLEGATLHYRKSLFYSGRRLHIKSTSAETFADHFADTFFIIDHKDGILGRRFLGHFS